MLGYLNDTVVQPWIHRLGGALCAQKPQRPGLTVWLDSTYSTDVREKTV